MVGPCHFSGAIGENELCELPDRVRKYLIGDITIPLKGIDMSIEVKYRANATGFASLYKLIASKTDEYLIFSDAIVIRGTDNFVKYYDGLLTDEAVEDSILNTTLTKWLDHCSILAVKSKRHKDWFFIIKR